MNSQSRKKTCGLFLIFLLIAIFSIGSLLIALNQIPKKQNSLDQISAESDNSPFLPVKTTSNEIGAFSQANHKGWRTYSNIKANFSIEYPEYLIVIEDHQSINNELQKGRVIFCAHPVEISQNACDVGFQILYSIPTSDGWGGGCNKEDLKQITVLGISRSVCYGESYLSQLYLEHPQKLSEVSLSAHFGDDFLVIEARQMLDSFAFISPQK